MEAKPPKENPFSETHLGQAWWYATDPQANVPMMVMTNGRRLGVFDLVQEEWDSPVLDLRHDELVDRARAVGGNYSRCSSRNLERAHRAGAATRLLALLGRSLFLERSLGLFLDAFAGLVFVRHRSPSRPEAVQAYIERAPRS
jgi:hypothetical protein